MQAFDSSGAKIGGEQIVSTNVNTNVDTVMALTVTVDNDVVVAWQTGYSIEAQTFRFATPYDLVVSGTTDERSQSLSGIGTINFTAAATATFDSSQFDNFAVSSAPTLNGDANANSVAIALSTQNNFSASRFAFTNWSDNDHLVITGNANANNLIGSTRNDIVQGGAGNDHIVASLGADTLDGGSGTDLADYSQLGGGVFVDLGDGYAFKATTAGASFANPATAGNVEMDHLTAFENVAGTSFNDRLYGSAAANVFSTGLGNDIVYGEGGSDTIDYSAATGGVFVDLAGAYGYKGAAGSSYLAGAAGVSIAGIDNLIAISNIIGSNFNDRLYGTSGNNRFATGLGSDVVYGQGGSDTIDYSAAAGGVFVDLAGAYSYKGAAGSSFLAGGANVSLVGQDSLNGIANVTGSDFNDRLYGTAGANVFATGLGSDIVYGEGGSDTIDYSAAAGGVFVDLAGGYAYKGAAGSSYLAGGAGVSIAGIDNLIAITNVTGSDFSDRLYGAAAGGSTLSGNDGNDVIYGFGGNNVIDGGAGNDKIVASGNDILTGGTGSDQFIFTSTAVGGDTITDFGAGTDSLYFAAGHFGSYTAGQAVSFVSGTGTSDAMFGSQTTQGFAYNTATGALYFDSDGAGGAAATLMATLSGAPTINASNITIY